MTAAYEVSERTNWWRKKANIFEIFEDFDRYEYQFNMPFLDRKDRKE